MLTRRRLAGLVPAAFPLMAGPLLAGSGNNPACVATHGDIIPILNMGGRPVVEAKMNGVPVHMLLDTGSTHTILTPGAAEVLRLPQDRLRKSYGRGIGGATYEQNALLARFQLGAIDVERLTVPIAPMPGILRVSQRMVGVIGQDLLASGEVDLDFAARQMIIYPRNKCRADAPLWTAGHTSLRLYQEDDEALALTATLNGRSMKALLDTGAAGTTISRSAFDRLGLPLPSAEAEGTASGMGSNERRVRVFQSDLLEFGELRVRQLEVGILMEGHIPMADMVIGMDVLGSLRLWISYLNRRVHVVVPRGSNSGP